MKQTRLITYMILFSVISISAAAFTLVDQENFESYIVGDHTTSDFITNSSSDWNCSSISAFPTCDRTIFGTGAGTGYWEIEQDTFNNRYLTISSLGGSNSGYRETGLVWDVIDSPAPTDNQGAYAVSFDVKLNQQDISGFTGSFLLRPLGYLNGYSNFYGISDSALYGVGGFLSTVFHDRVRYRYEFDRMKPDFTFCDLSTTNFKNIVVQHYYTNETSGVLNHTRIFVNGVECWSEPTSNDQSAFGSMFNTFQAKSIGGYSMSYDNIKIYYGELSDEDILGAAFQYTTASCPYANCIYYDDFSSYPDGFNLTQNNYQQQNAAVEDEQVFLGDYFSNDLPQYTYENVESTFFIDIFGNYTHPELEDNTYILSFQDYCGNGNKVSDVYLMFGIPSNSSGIFSGYETEVFVYVKNPYQGQGSLQLSNLGSFVMQNGNTFGFNRKYDFTTNKFYFNLISTEDIEAGILPDSTLTSFDFNAVCDNVQSFKVERLGTAQIPNFYGITELSYVGGLLFASDISGDITFEYQEEFNETTEGVLFGEQKEGLHNVAYMFGFKTTASKVVFFIFMLIILIFALLQSNAPASAKTIGIIFIIIGGIFGGWKWEFIPTSFIVIILFLLAIIGALVFTNLFKGGGVES